jgi:hypothetical protein
MSTPSPESSGLTGRWQAPATLQTRAVLAATWSLFQVSWPSCLPLALVAVCATGAPGAESIRSGEGRGLDHSAEWWGVYFASALLTLACYGAVMLRQQALATGAVLRTFDALRRSALLLPVSVGCAIVTLAAVVLGLVLLVLPGLAAIVWLCFAWTAVLSEGLGPLQAARRSIALVRGRFLQLAAILGAALAAVLVFLLLAGIFFGVAMSIAGQDASGVALAVSRVLFLALLSLPVMYLSATVVSAYQAIIRQP